MWLILILVAPILLALIFEIKNYRLKRLINHFNGPPTLPLIGNAHMVGKKTSDIIINLVQWWIQYGKTNYRIWIGSHPIVLITEPKDVEFILTDNNFIKKSDEYDLFYPWLGEGLLTSTGAKWFKHRKMITPSFHFKILQYFHEVMNSNSTKFIEKLEKASAGDTIFDFQHLVHYFTLDVICETAMGVSINAMDEPDSAVARAFKDMSHSIHLRVFHPLKNKNAIFKFFPEYQEFRKTLKILNDFTREIIQRRMESRKENIVEETADEDDSPSRKKLAFLDTLLTSTIDNRPLSENEIYEEVSTFMFEGHDTTSSGIAFLTYLLSRHKEVQEKVYAEQERILGPKPKCDATFRDVSQMHYLDLVIKEAQRVYPSVPFIGRGADRDYDMNGRIIPSGTTAIIFIYAMGFNDKYFPDPYRFDPERFNTDDQTEKRNPFEYVPFSAGPRNCIGQKFAILEIKTTISKIVRHFEILPPLDELWSKDGYIENYLGLPPEEAKARHPHPSKYDPSLSGDLILKATNGISIRLRKRF